MNTSAIPSFETVRRLHVPVTHISRVFLDIFGNPNICNTIAYVKIITCSFRMEIFTPKLAPLTCFVSLSKPWKKWLQVEIAGLSCVFFWKNCFRFRVFAFIPFLAVPIIFHEFYWGSSSQISIHIYIAHIHEETTNRLAN